MSRSWVNAHCASWFRRNKSKNTPPWCTGSLTDMGWQGSRPEHEDVIKYSDLVTEGLGWILFGGGDIKWWYCEYMWNMWYIDCRWPIWQFRISIAKADDATRWNVGVVMDLGVIRTESFCNKWQVIQTKLWYIWFIYHIPSYVLIFYHVHVGVSENRGTPKWTVYN